MTPEEPIELFYSYAQEDEKWYEELEKALSQLRRHQIITWSRRQIIAGQDSKQEIDRHLNAAQVILLLISRNYLASDHCYTEMERAIERQRARTSHVIPILLSSCDWKDAPCAHLQPLPMNMSPITLWTDRDEALLAVTQGIRQAVENLSLRTQNEEEIAKYGYDVFLCYNTESKEDKLAVEEIGNQLRKSGIIPWFGDWEVRPGTSWQDEMEQQIEYISSAAVFVGQEGVKHWERLITRAFLREFVEYGRPIIYIYLPNASNTPQLSTFLPKNIMGPIDFRSFKERRNLLPDEEPFNLLIRDIKREHVQGKGDPYILNAITSPILRVTEQHVQKEQVIPKSHVLITFLGTSPIVVSAMYDLLTKKEGLAIDKIVVFYQKGEDIGYELAREALIGACELQREILPFGDTNRQTNIYLFFKRLYTLLNSCQARGDIVYLSLEGGPESMKAVIASAVPFFSCVENLYHVIDTDEDHFLTIEQLDLDLTPSQRELAMHPDLESLVLVDIPIKSAGKQIDQQLVSRLLSASKDELERMEYEEAEKADFVQTIVGEGTILEAMVTQRVIAQFTAMCQQNRDAARRVRDCLERMQSTADLRSVQTDAFPYRPTESAKAALVDLHIFESFGTPVHPVFYTRPTDIYSAWDSAVEQVVICELDTGEDGTYRSLQEIVTAPGFSTRAAGRLEKLPSVPPSKTIESVLIVPLGESPMVATQLFTLLTRQEGHHIRQVILVYPAQATEIANGAELIERALQEEAGISCIHACVEDLADIDSAEAYQSYQATLEATIEKARQEYPDCTIDLALSDGRKGMTAMTIFAAQKKHLPHVYYMLIASEQLSDTIDDQTTFEALDDPGLSRQERNDRLFLRAYEEESVYTKLKLIKIPVFSP